MASVAATAAGSFVRVEALIRQLHRILERGSGLHAGGAARASDREARALLVERKLGSREHAVAVGRVRRDDELVPAHAIRAAAAGHCDGELATERGQQGIAGGMPEGVVVGLEPVEIEDRHERGLTIRRDRDLLHVGNQLAAISQSGQGVRHGVFVAAPTCPEQVMERDRECHQQQDRRGERRGRGHRPRTLRVGAVAEIGPVELPIQPGLDPARLLAGSQLQSRLRRRAPRHEGSKMVDEREVATTGGLDPARLVAVTEDLELLQGRTIDLFRVGEPCRCLRRPRCTRSDRGTEGDRQQGALLVPQLRNHHLRPPSRIRTSLHSRHDTGGEQPDHPDTHDERGRPAGPVPTQDSRTFMQGRQFAPRCAQDNRDSGRLLVTHRQSFVEHCTPAIGACDAGSAVNYRLL